MVLCLHQNLVIIITSLFLELSMSYLYHFYNTDQKWSSLFCSQKNQDDIKSHPIHVCFSLRPI